MAGPCPHDPKEMCPCTEKLTIHLGSDAEITSIEPNNDRIKIDIDGLDTVVITPNSSSKFGPLPGANLGANTELQIRFKKGGQARKRIEKLTVAKKGEKFVVIHKPLD